MSKMLLTAPAIAKLKAGTARREIGDAACSGLYLVVQVTGHKSFAMRFRRPNGDPAKLTLGPAALVGGEMEGEPVLGSPLTLAAARRLAMQVHQDRARGKDVVAAMHREKLERAVRGGADFARATKDFVEQYAMRHTRGWEQTARYLGLEAAEDGVLTPIPRGLADRWKDRAVAEITRDEIHDITDEVRDRGVPGLERRTEGVSEARARSMLSALSRMFDWLVENRRAGENPCANVPRPGAPAARDRVLTDAEIKAFWKAAGSERLEISAPLRLLLLTGQRLDEVVQMRRSELNDDGAMWTLPGERTKNGRVHVVPLSELARSLIAGVATTGEFVFTTDGRTPIACGSRVKRKLDGAMQIPAWRLHDLRRTCATGMAEIGIAPHIVEAVLNHISGARAGVAGTYNRAIHAPEKRAALERWAVHIAGLVEGRGSDNVVRMMRP